MKPQSVIIDHRVLSHPDAESNLKAIIKKIARLTMGFLKAVARFLDEGARRHHRVQMCKEEWQWRNPYCIRGMF